MGLRGRKSILREAMKSLLDQHKVQGIDFAQIQQCFGSIDRCRLLKLLKNMKQCGDAHSKRSDGWDAAKWFPGCEDPDAEPSTFSPTEWRRQQLARMTDQANPIAYYGQELQGGRCASVWEYASHMRAAAGARA